MTICTAANQDWTAANQDWTAANQDWTAAGKGLDLSLIHI